MIQCMSCDHVVKVRKMPSGKLAPAIKGTPSEEITIRCSNRKNKTRVADPECCPFKVWWTPCP